MARELRNNIRSFRYSDRVASFRWDMEQGAVVWYTIALLN